MKKSCIRLTTSEKRTCELANMHRPLSSVQETSISLEISVPSASVQYARASRSLSCGVNSGGCSACTMLSVCRYSNQFHVVGIACTGR